MTGASGGKVTVVPEPDQAVLVRGRPAVVREVVEHVDAVSRERYHLVEVEYLDGWDFPSHDRVIWEREWRAEVLHSAGLPRGLGDHSQQPDPVETFQAFLDALRWSSLARVPGLTSEGQELTAPWQASVAVEPYQLYPVLQALDMPRVTLLLADDVGLGKTIQAGLVLTEMMARRRLHRILIVVPASLQLQWRDEMREKFGLTFTVMDRNAIADIQRELGMDTNPWTVTPRVITSMDFLRQPDVLSQFLASAETLERGPNLAWDALVVDEAHNVAPQGFQERSQRSEAILHVSAHFEHRLFLTATPHNGLTACFSGLLELLDPVRFRQTAELSERDRKHLGAVMVRRMKADLNDRAEAVGRPRPFPRRDVEGRSFKWTNDEQQVVNTVRAYREAGNKLLRQLPREEQRIGRFVFSLLTKRLLSSTYAFARTWWQHVAGYEHGVGGVGELLAAHRRLQEETSDDIEKARREEDAVRQGASWLARYGEQLADTRDRVSDSLEAAGWGPEVAEWAMFPDDWVLPADGKWIAFERWLEEYLRTGRRFRDDERAILFTEYKDTLDYLLARLRSQGLDDPQVRFLFGGSSMIERDDVKTAFNDPDDPVRLLVATDVAAEGLNLQWSCRYVFHWEIPWNPMRLEQRNGRVDRHGQPRDVKAFHFSSDHDEDVAFLDYVVNKVHQVREDLGSVGNVIDMSVEEHFTTCRLERDELDARVAQTLELSASKADLATAIDQDKQRPIQQAVDVLHRTEQRLRLEPKRLARLLSVAFGLDGGILEPEGDLWRIAKRPPGWSPLIKDQLEIRSGLQEGSVPRLAFDPEYFVDRTAERQVFRPRTDVALLRLGHPLIQRAIARLRQRLWQPEGQIKRWTVVAADVEAPALFVGVLVQAANELREPLHSELLEIGLTASPPHHELAVPTDGWQPLGESSLKQWRSWLADSWDDLRLAIEGAVAARGKKLTDRIGKLLIEQLVAERERQEELFEHRLRELAKEPTDRAVERIRKELLKAEQQVIHLTLFPEENAQRKQRLAELEKKLEEVEFERINARRERLRIRLQSERKRMLDEILPRRFCLNRFQLTPVAVALLVPGGGRP